MTVQIPQSHLRGLAFLTAVVVLVTGVTFQRAFAYNEADRDQMRQQLVAKFCEQTEWMRCFGEQPSQCADVVSRFIKPCLNQYLDNGQEPFTDPQRARKTALNILKCFNAEFGMSHPMGKDRAPECADAPAHLQ